MTGNTLSARERINLINRRWKKEAYFWLFIIFVNLLNVTLIAWDSYK